MDTLQRMKHINILPYGILPWLIDVIHKLKPITIKHLTHKCGIKLLSYVYLQCVILELLFGYSFFSQCIGITYNNKRSIYTVESTQCLGTKYLVSCIKLPIFCCFFVC